MTQVTNTTQEKRRWFAVSAAMGALLALAACASAGPPPTAALAAAQTRLTDAEHAGALETAAIPYNRARERLASAQAAAQQGDNEEATRLADEAEADAHLALVTAQAARAEQAANAVRQDAATLRQETAPPPAMPLQPMSPSTR